MKHTYAGQELLDKLEGWIVDLEEVFKSNKNIIPQISKMIFDSCNVNINYTGESILIGPQIEGVGFQNDVEYHTLSDWCDDSDEFVVPLLKITLMKPAQITSDYNNTYLDDETISSYTELESLFRSVELVDYNGKSIDILSLRTSLDEYIKETVDDYMDDSGYDEDDDSEYDEEELDDDRTPNLTGREFEDDSESDEE